MKTVQRLNTAGLIAVLLSVGPGLGANTSDDSPGFTDPKEWNFQVFLDDDPIGYHNFRLNPREEGYRLQTEAEFEVDFLFFTAYRYQHENVEVWENGCLQRIESRTNDNGDEFRVVGSREGGEFDLAGTGTNGSLESDCVRTFAYWNLDKLKAGRLLNAQTGEYVPVQVERVGRETIQIKGRDIAAERYRVDGEDLDLDVWYTPEGDWVKLTSNVRKGRQLRYELRES
jgi:hypothetical protein